MVQVANLPHSIEAFFIQSASSPSDVNTVRAAHARFCSRYGARARGVPLLVYDADGGGSAPFSLAAA